MWPPYQKSGSRRLTLREPLWLSWLETFHMHCYDDPYHCSDHFSQKLQTWQKVCHQNDGALSTLY